MAKKYSKAATLKTAGIGTIFGSKNDIFKLKWMESAFFEGAQPTLAGRLTHFRPHFGLGGWALWRWVGRVGRPTKRPTAQPGWAPNPKYGGEVGSIWMPNFGAFCGLGNRKKRSQSTFD